MTRLAGEYKRATDRLHFGISTNLYHLTTTTGTLLPNLHLKYGEVKRIGTYPVSGTAAMDIYEGIYLDTEKVAIKVVRAVNADNHSAKVSFHEITCKPDFEEYASDSNGRSKSGATFGRRIRENISCHFMASAIMMDLSREWRSLGACYVY
jgi:hypothetical protein